MNNLSLREINGMMWKYILGVRISKKIHEGTNLWSMSSHAYLKAAINEIEIKLKKPSKITVSE